jgi:hypothetical protein
MVSRRAIIMEMSEKHLIVLTPSGEFRRVTRSVHTGVDIGDEIELVRRRRVPRRAWAWTAAALVVLLLFPIVMVPTSNAEPIVAYVTLDVNPSVELGINDEEEVRELHGLNEEGKQLASSIAYKGEKAADVVASLVEKTSASVVNAQAEDDHDIVIASVVIGDKLDDPDQFEVQLELDIHKAVNKVVQSTDNVTVLSVPKEVRDEAKKNGISMGKMAVYLMAKSKNPKMKLDSLKSQSIHDWTASEGGIQSVVPSKQKAAAAVSTPVPKAADEDDKDTELQSKAASNKKEKEALKALLERERRAKAKAEREEKRNSGKNEGDKPKSSNASGAEQSGGKQGEKDNDNRSNVKYVNNGVNSSNSSKQNGNSSKQSNNNSKNSSNNRGGNGSNNEHGSSRDGDTKNSSDSKNDNSNNKHSNSGKEGSDDKNGKSSNDGSQDSGHNNDKD